MTGIDVWLASRSTSMLWWFGSRCWTRMKAIPGAGGRLDSSLAQASRPPAEAPMATIGNVGAAMAVARAADLAAGGPT